MFVYKSEAEYREVEDKKYVKVTLYADTVPGTMPVPADIPGYDSSFDFMPGSTLYIVTTGAVYMVGEDGNWHEQ